MRVITYDCETTIRSKRSFKGDPHDPDNYIVCSGIKINNQETSVYYNKEPTTKHTSIFKGMFNGSKVDLLVGQNIKFDLLCLLREDKDGILDCLDKTELWDVQLAEYLLSAQQTKMASLDKLADIYHLPLKPDRIKAYWNAGVDTTGIPLTELRDYQRHDCDITYEVFIRQIVRAKSMNMLELIKTQMDALLATTIMEFNGMRFDRQKALDMLPAMNKEHTELTAAAKKLMLKLSAAMIDPNPASNDDLALAIFGGSYKYTSNEPMVDKNGNPVLYKTGSKKGLPRTKKTVHEVQLPYNYIGPPNLEWMNKKRLYKVNEDVLRNIIGDEDQLETVRDLCETVLKLRSVRKDIGTYFKPYIDLVYQDGCIHGQLIHTNTNTGRLSAANPNLQNITNG